MQLGTNATLAMVLEAAQRLDAPPLLFLSELPSGAANASLPEGAADKAWQQWKASCSWAREPKLSRRRRLDEQWQSEENKLKQRQQRPWWLQWKIAEVWRTALWVQRWLVHWPEQHVRHRPLESAVRMHPEEWLDL